MKSHSLSGRTENQPQAYRRLHYITQHSSGEWDLLGGIERQGGKAELSGFEGHELFLTASGWAGSQAARGGAGRPPGFRAARSESLCCDPTGPADTPGLGAGQLRLRNVAQRVDTLHFIVSTRLSRKPRGGASLQKLERPRLLSLSLSLPRVPYT